MTMTVSQRETCPW